MRDIFDRLGGHPYRLILFAKHAAAHKSVGRVLDDLSGVQKEMLEFTLLDKAIAQLLARAALLLHRAVVFEKPVPIEGLAFMLGVRLDCMPDIAEEVNALLNWAWRLRTGNRICKFAQRSPRLGAKHLERDGEEGISPPCDGLLDGPNRR